MAKRICQDGESIKQPEAICLSKMPNSSTVVRMEISLLDAMMALTTYLSAFTLKYEWSYWIEISKKLSMVHCGLTIFGLVPGLRISAPCNIRRYYRRMKSCSLILRVCTLSTKVGRSLGLIILIMMCSIHMILRRSSNDWGSRCSLNNSIKSCPLHPPPFYQFAKTSLAELSHLSRNFLPSTNPL